MKRNLWTSEVRFISGNKEILEFADKDKATLFYNTLLSIKKDNNNENQFFETGLSDILININNIETISRPKEMIDISTLI